MALPSYQWTVIPSIWNQPCTKVTTIIHPPIQYIHYSACPADEAVLQAAMILSSQFQQLATAQLDTVPHKMSTSLQRNVSQLSSEDRLFMSSPPSYPSQEAQGQASWRPQHLQQMDNLARSMQTMAVQVGGWFILWLLCYTPTSTMDLEYNNKLQSCSWGVKTSNLDSDEPNSAMNLWRKYKISNIIIHVNIPHDIYHLYIITRWPYFGVKRSVVFA